MRNVLLIGPSQGDELPEEFTDPRTRAGRIKAALVELEEQNRAESRAEQAATAGR